MGQGIRSILAPRHLVYGYSNARVRAMRPHLLSRRQAEDILKVKTNAAVAEYLSRTIYKGDFAGMPAKISESERVELAVSRNFARTAQKLLRITPAQSKAALTAFLFRYDAHNLRTILLSRKLGKPHDAAKNLIMAAGSMSQKEIDAILSAKSSEEQYEAIRSTAFGAGLLRSKALKAPIFSNMRTALYSPTQEQLEALLSAIDSHYYGLAAGGILPGEKDADAILKLIESEADAKNIITAMRLKKSGADKHAIMKNMVKGGGMSKSQLGSMAGAKGISEIAALASSFFISATGKGEFAAAEKRFKEDGQLSHFEVAFEHSIARRSLHALRRSIMSIGAIVGFLLLKEEEMNNIRKIVRGKELGLPMERIAEMLVLVG